MTMNTGCVLVEGEGVGWNTRKTREAVIGRVGGYIK